MFSENTSYNIKEQYNKLVMNIENGFETVDEAIGFAGLVFSQDDTENVAVVGYEIEHAEDGHWTSRGHIGYIKTIYKA